MIFNLNPYSTCKKQQKTPCLNCEMRDIGCHGSCMLYESYKVDLEESKLKYKIECESPRSNTYRKWANGYYGNYYSEV